MFKVGDKVKTFQGEKGVIHHAWDRETKEYDWWVDLHFHAKGRDRTCREPFKESQLEKIEEKDLT